MHICVYIYIYVYTCMSKFHVMVCDRIITYEAPRAPLPSHKLTLLTIPLPSLSLIIIITKYYYHSIINTILYYYYYYYPIILLLLL